MLKQIRVSTGFYTIQRKEWKETRHAYVLVWMYNDTNLSCGGVHIFVQQGEKISEMNAISFLVFIVCHNEETGNTIQRVFCV